jgi:MFS family permease
VLVLLGLYVRLSITETPVFEAAQSAGPVGFPLGTVLRRHTRPLVAGILICVATFVLFYLMTVFTISWGTTALHYGRDEFLLIQLFGIVFFGLTIPVSALLAERGRRRVMISVTLAIAAFGLVFARLFTAGLPGVLVLMAVGLGLMGMTYGPLGTVVSELFPTRVRYTGSSIAFSLAGILGASLAPYIATDLARKFGLAYVGYYLAGAAAVTLVGLLMVGETKDEAL